MFRPRALIRTLNDSVIVWIVNPVNFPAGEGKTKSGWFGDVVGISLGASHFITGGGGGGGGGPGFYPGVHFVSVRMNFFSEWKYNFLYYKSVHLFII